MDSESRSYYLTTFVYPILHNLFGSSSWYYHDLSHSPSDSSSDSYPTSVQDSTPSSTHISIASLANPPVRLVRVVLWVLFKLGFHHVDHAMVPDLWVKAPEVCLSLLVCVCTVLL